MELLNFVEPEGFAVYEIISEIAAEIGISNQKATRGLQRFLMAGLAGSEKDAP